LTDCSRRLEGVAAPLKRLLFEQLRGDHHFSHFFMEVPMTRPTFYCELLENRRLLCHFVPDFAAIGDSFTDEYQFAGAPLSNARNFVE